MCVAALGMGITPIPGLPRTPKGSAVEVFNDLAPRYPVFKLQPLNETTYDGAA
jgi:hypothetical protein